MQRSQFRFTMASMMAGTAILGILSWIVAGLIKDGMPWLRHHTVLFLVTFPLFFSLFATFVVTFFQWYREGRRR